MFKYKMIKSEKFHSMQATVETVRFDDGMTVKRLVSYDSVVCDVDLETGTIFFYPRFQYSPTTIRQLTRFLNENAPLKDGRWSIGLVRELHKRADGEQYPTMGRYSVHFPSYVLGTKLRW